MNNLFFSKKCILIITITLFSCLVLFNEYLFFLQKQHQGDQERKEVLSKASIIRTNLEREINTTLNLAMGLIVSVSANPDISNRDFSIMANELLKSSPTIKNIGLAKDNVISHMFPLKDNEKALGLSYLHVESQKGSVLQAMETGKTVIAGPVSLAQGGKAFIGRIPIYSGMDKERYWGMASVVVNIESFYDSCGLKDNSSPLS